jgi:hypothetical protein
MLVSPMCLPDTQIRLGRGTEVREVLTAADLFQAEGLLKHCLEAFGGGLMVGTAVEALVWAHGSGLEEARRLTAEYHHGGDAREGDQGW